MNPTLPADQPDPLIDEVRGLRQSLADEHGNDMGRLCDHLADIQRQYATRVVNRRQARTSPSGGAAALP